MFCRTVKSLRYIQASISSPASVQPWRDRGSSLYNQSLSIIPQYPIKRRYLFTGQMNNNNNPARVGQEEISGPVSKMSVVENEKYKEVISREQDDITYITLNRPEKLNAISPNMYAELTDALTTAGKNDTRATVINGMGKYFCGGTDLTTMTKAGNDPVARNIAAEESIALLETFVAAFIDHPKLLVGLVHGPCFGIAFTTMSLYDVVYASDQALFYAPFTSLGLVPEGTSSYSFPKIMGPKKANEVLLLGKKLTAQEALQCGFVTEVFPAETFVADTKRKLLEILELGPISLTESKMLLRSTDQALLHEANKRECQKLIRIMQGQECGEAIAKFMSKRTK